MSDFAPVALFVYNRINHTRSILASLEDSEGIENVDLHIFSDGAKSETGADKIQAVREIIDEYARNNSCKSVTIHRAEKNKGLAKSIIEGVTQLVNASGKVIVLEDDLNLSRDCLKFMNDALDFYEDDKRVGAVSGYSLPIRIPKDYDKDVYLSKTGNSWGWSTWKDVWNEVDWEVLDYEKFKADKDRQKAFDNIQYGIAGMLIDQMEGRIDSWAVRWDYHFFKKGLFTLYPCKSKISNQGFDGEGTHCNDSARGIFETDVNCGNYNLEIINPDERIIKRTAMYYKRNIFQKGIGWIKRKVRL